MGLASWEETKFMVITSENMQGIGMIDDVLVEETDSQSSSEGSGEPQSGRRLTCVAGVISNLRSHPERSGNGRDDDLNTFIHLLGVLCDYALSPSVKASLSASVYEQSDTFASVTKTTM